MQCEWLLIIFVWVYVIVQGLDLLNSSFRRVLLNLSFTCFPTFLIWLFLWSYYAYTTECLIIFAEETTLIFQILVVKDAMHFLKILHYQCVSLREYYDFCITSHIHWKDKWTFLKEEPLLNLWYTVCMLSHSTIVVTKAVEMPNLKPFFRLMDSSFIHTSINF